MSERKVVDYKLISAVTGFEDQVKKAIKEGWQPLGGVAEYMATFSQAMVKYE